MRKIGFILLLGGLALSLAAAPVLAQVKAQTTCPVLGGNVDRNIYVDYKGQRIYFCCTGCDQEFKKNPEKYLEKMKAQGITPEKTPTPAKQGK